MPSDPWDLTIVILWVAVLLWSVSLGLHYPQKWRHASIRDIFLWARQFSMSNPQLQKAFDWHIAQWSGVATAVLAATLAFVSSVVIEKIKNPRLVFTGAEVLLIGLGVASSLGVFAFAHYKIVSLRRRFLRLHSILCDLQP